MFQLNTEESCEGSATFTRRNQNLTINGKFAEEGYFKKFFGMIVFRKKIQKAYYH